jgi:hypothetical protein
MVERHKPGVIRDAIVATFKQEKRVMSVAEVRAAVSERLGEDVASSSVRSYLNINTPGVFLRTGRGQYRLARR